MHHSGIYPKVREVIDVDTRYYLLALDRKCMTFLKPRTSGNSSSYLQSAVEEAHSEEWARQTIRYLTWFETVHSNDILSHLEEMKGVITSTYGRILKMDSTKKITKKLAGSIGDTAAWMSNIGNELGQVLNSVLTTGEGAGLEELCQGIVTRYENAGQAEPEAIYVDRDCCSQSGVSSVLRLFRPWKFVVRLDVFHFMRRFNCGLTTEHHPLYGTFCSKLSACIFEWDQEDVQRLKEAKKGEWKSSHGGNAPTEALLLASISTGEMAKHCRRRTRAVEEIRVMISGLLESMWELTDTTGLRLVNPDSMHHVWEVQQKHLECIQDPAGVELYTKTGTLQKGGKVLDVLRCGRGSSSLESFHRHQCAFVPGFRCNALHTQMYMLEGVSRWNMNRAKEAVAVVGASTLRTFDVRLMSHLNSMSQRVLGIAVEYLLAQSNRGDLLVPQQLPEIPTEELEDDGGEPDVTVCQVADLRVGDPDPPICAVEAQVTLEGDSGPRSLDEDIIVEEDDTQDSTSDQNSRCDSRGVLGWDAVDDLAAYLVGLNRTITALSSKEEADIVHLYMALPAMDKEPLRFGQKARKKTVAGPWRAPRKPSGSAPGQQAAERLFMTHGQAAQDPEVHRVSECVCLRLLKEFQQAPNRPKDTRSRTLPIPQSIVVAYSHLKQLLEDSRVVLEKTNVVLIPVNNTTISSWLLRRDKRKDRDMLLQGTILPKRFELAKDSLPEAQTLPAAPVQHGHEAMVFEEPENREGEAVIRPRHSVRSALAQHYQPGSYPPPPFQPPADHPLYLAPPPPGTSVQPRQRTWRQKKAAQENEELMARGEPPRKKFRDTYQYICKQCGQGKNKSTGHTQLKGRWYCPASGLTLAEWKDQLTSLASGK
ncbi:uncharacterized protein LOC134010140 [Osmerus eperlanus]|uniref:uncharacterized protein LOC134010140 n=1 Tax=Osmerus eperlanus TaxID=29151 RepID=UPI002E108B59